MGSDMYTELLDLLAEVYEELDRHSDMVEQTDCTMLPNNAMRLQERVNDMIWEIKDN